MLTVEVSALPGDGSYSSADAEDVRFTSPRLGLVVEMLNVTCTFPDAGIDAKVQPTLVTATESPIGVPAGQLPPGATAVSDTPAAVATRSLLTTTLLATSGPLFVIVTT